MTIRSPSAKKLKSSIERDFKDLMIRLDDFLRQDTPKKTGALSQNYVIRKHRTRRGGRIRPAFPAGSQFKGSQIRKLSGGI